MITLGRMKKAVLGGGTSFSRSGNAYLSNGSVVPANKPRIEFPNMNIDVKDFTTDFAGKVAGSIAENPHIAKINNANTLSTPSTFTVEFSGSSYTGISTQNASCAGQNANTNSTYSQMLFSFDLIRYVEKLYGSIPALNTAGKVAWLKANLYSLTFNWWGYGSSPTGNKATTKAWANSAWSSAGAGNTASTVTKGSDIAYTAGIQAMLQSDGFIHYLVYADPSDGVTNSTVYTDYVSLDVKFNAGVKIGVITTTDFTGKVAGSYVENPHYVNWSNQLSLLPPSSGSWGTEPSTSSIDPIKTLNGTSATCSNTIANAIAQMIFKFNLIRVVELKYGKIPGTTTADKVAWLKTNLQKVSCKWSGYGSSVGGNRADLKPWISGAWTDWGIFATNSSVATYTCDLIGINIANAIQSDGFVHFLAHAQASDGVTASVINTDYVSLDIQIMAGVQLYNPSVMVEEGTTNLVPVDKKSFSVLGGSSAGTFDVTNGLVQGGTYTLSGIFAIFPDDTSTNDRITMQFMYSDSTSDLVDNGGNQQIRDGKERFWKITATANGTKTLTTIRIFPFNYTVANNLHRSYRQLQLEQKAYATSFTDSTRASEVLSIPTAGISPTQGTIHQWVYVDSRAKRQISSPTSQYPKIFTAIDNNGYDSILLYHNNGSAVWAGAFRNSAGTTTYLSTNDSNTPDGWNLFSLRYRSDKADLFINGVQVVTIANPTLPSTLSNFYSGYSSNNSYLLNAPMGQTLITNDYQSDATIQAIYNNFQPERVTTNLLQYADPTSIYNFTVQSGITACTAGQVDARFAGGAVFGDNTSSRWAYQTPTLQLGKTYTFSAFVKMDDGSAPVVSNTNTSGDFTIVINGHYSSTNLTATLVSGTLYKVSGTMTITDLLSANCGICKYNTQSTKTFKVSGFQLEEGSSPTTLMAGGQTRVNTIVQPNFKTRKRTMFGF